MPFQDNFRQYVAYKQQSGLGTIASATGATILPWTGGRAQAPVQAIQPNQIRRDGQPTRGRHGTRSAQASYPGEMQLANYDAIMEAVLRGTWQANAVTISNATTGWTSATIAVSGSTVTFTGEASGQSMVTLAGAPKVGDVIVWASGVAAGDRDKPLRVTGVTATTITFAESLATVAGPEGTWSFTVPKKLLCPTASTLAFRYFTVEEAELVIDGSEIYQDCVWNSVDLAMSPNGMFTITPMWIGTGAMTAETDGDSPYFTTPADPVAAVPIAGIDAKLRLGSTDYVDITAFNLSISLGATATPVVGSKISPDVFTGVMSVGGSLTILRENLQAVTDALAETQLSLSVLLQPEASDTDFFSLYMGNFTIQVPDKSEASRQAGPRTQTLNFPQELVGIDERGGAYDATTIKFQRSNA
ncbi:phage tail tube protein [Oceanibaculum indicum]|uniref:Tail tube protein n=1 Tax=Oceanibaculum indicum TaxID=526216 RepID=A0A420WGJ2_9PROT|nr:phage tail tube protein [Oceanibaculum indicum]RKQ70118.1 hypothetical protein BCL74_2058 [Oceanibaculum indicum]